MKTNIERLLFILAIGAWLIGVASTGVSAGIALSCGPNEATVNSVWNWLCVWTDDTGIMPMIDPNGDTEGTMDYGLLEGSWVDYTIGTIRAAIPAEWDDALTFYPLVPAPDGFAGFPAPTDPLEILPGEVYQEPAYATVQPDPVDTERLETDGGYLYDHGLDYVPEYGIYDVRQYKSAADSNPGIIVPVPFDAAPADPNPDGSLPERVIAAGFDVPGAVVVVSREPVTLYGVWLDEAHTLPLQASLAPANTVNPAWTQTYNVIVITDPLGIPTGTTRLYISYSYGTAGIAIPAPIVEIAPADPNPDGTIPERVIAPGTDPKSNACIAVTNSPVALVGVWRDALRTQPVKAKVSPANGVNPNWTQRYNVIEIMEPNGIPAGTTRLYISYYCAGKNYVITQRAPLPLPYTVYTVRLVNADDLYIYINDSIIGFDPLRNGDPADPATTPDKCGLMGIYPTPQLDQATDPADATNYFDLTAFTPTATRYVRAQGYGKAYFSTPLPDAYRRAGTILYVKVSTNAVDGVWTVPRPTPADTNYYPRADGTVIGYCARPGIIRLGTPLPDPDLNDQVNMDAGAIVAGKLCYVKVRHLSPDSYTIGRTPNLGYVTDVDDLRPALPQGVTYGYAANTTTIRTGGRFTIGSPIPPTGTYAARVHYNQRCTRPTVYLNGYTPMNYIRFSAYDGAEFRVSVSAGLNMYDPITGGRNPRQNPAADRALNVPALNNKLLYDPYQYPMYPESSLQAGSPWPASEVRRFSAIGAMVKDGRLVIQEIRNIPVTVHHSSSYQSGQGTINYNGVADLDWLTCYSDGNLPYQADVDPLAVEPLTEANPTYPDNGSGSTHFVFRVHYNNRNGLLAKAWLPAGADLWYGSASGVVLYLDVNGTGDYKPHFMHPDYEQPQPPGMGASIYVYRVIPHNAIGVGAGDPGYPWPIPHAMDSYLYQSLTMGVYHYFFACSDDSLTFDNDSLLLTHQGDPIEWGATGGLYSSTGLDPSAARAVVGYPEIDRQPKRRYSYDGFQAFDATLFVDRPVRAPHQFEPELLPKYPWSCELHPRVSCELHMPQTDDFGTEHDDSIYGWGRFFGSLFPYRTAVNPAHAGSRGGGDQAALAETSGSYSKDTNVFRIMYKQLDNKAPISIKLWINNASEKTGATAAHQYRAFTMQRRADQNPQTQPNLYHDGCWYEYKLQSGTTDLPLGPHTYYFTANDGEQTARWPVRPDQYIITVPAGTVYRVGTTRFIDWWVPTRSLGSERQTAGYIDNDYVPGPYVNNAPLIKNVSVTPGTAKEGARFIYKATYSDADGQRINSATITIEVNDRGDRSTFALSPDPKYNFDPSVDNSALFKSGIDYILDTATIKDLALEKGVRRFYVEFTDDWGRQSDVNDMRRGENVRYPAGAGNWVSGPVISGNTPPTLSGGQVASLDGTSNAATLWTFRANYLDVNNDPPAVIKLFIGQLQPPDITVPTPTSKVRTILWDAGHTMLQSDPADRVYSDGAEHYFQTRLGGPDVGQAGKQYYFAFEAYDGIDYATYKSSSRDDQRSNAAGCFALQDATPAAPGDFVHFKIRPKIAKQITVPADATQIDPDPARVGDIIRIWGVYTNEDLTGTNYYDSGGNVPPDYIGGSIVLTTQPIPAGKVWVLVEADTPIIGPLPVEQPAPAGVIPDAEVLYNSATTGAPLLITDQKNGFISEDGTDRAVILMDGVGAHEGKPSGLYAAPDDPDSIASVEGVYWLDNPDTNHTYDNYFDPTAVVPPVVRAASLLDVNTVVMQDPDEVYKVLGVYDNPNLTGINYYVGAGYSLIPGFDKYLWQEAWVLGTMNDPAADPDWTIGPNVIWPTRPNNIASIKGVFATINVLDAQGNFLPLDLPGQITPYVVEGLYDAASDTITIPDDYNDAGAIQRILQISQLDPSGPDPGNIYYTSLDPAGDPYQSGDPITPNGPAPPGDADIVFVSYVPAFDFGELGEFVAVKKLLRLNPAPLPTDLPRVYVAYYPPGDLDIYKHVVLPIDFPDPAGIAYVKIWPKAFNPGDRYVKLTTRLPDFVVNANVINTTTVAPVDASVLPDIGEVTGVYVEGDPTNYYADTLNPFKPWETTNAGDTTIHLGHALPSPVPGNVTIAYVPKQRKLTIKYSDIQYTHQLLGSAMRVYWAGYYLEFDWLFRYLSPGTTHFVPYASNTFIVGNGPDPDTGDPRDIDGGIVGVWERSDLTGPNYFNPRRIGRYDDDPQEVRLTTEVPDGTNWLYGQGYQRGVYFIDRWNRDLRFDTDLTIADTDRIQVSYFFGTRMPKLLVANTLPSLSEGKVTPITGSRNAQYVYFVKYTDIDGPNGQMPSYVRVYIDGVAFDMVSATQGTPVYKAGAAFTYTPAGGLTGGSHTYHFEASDGAAIAWFDKNGAHQTERGLSTLDILDADGPWVNDPPQLSKGLVAPNPIPGGIGTRDSVDYTVNMKDVDNDPPYVYDPLRDTLGWDVTGSPRVWVDAGINDDTAAPIRGTIVALESDPLELAKKRVIVCKLDDGSGNLTDPNWTTDQFASKLMQITNGENWSDVYPSPYLSVYLIQSNTSNKLVIAADTLENDQLLVPNDPATGAPRYVQFRVNGLLMSKIDPTQQNYALGIDYKVTVPRLAVGTHKFHFTARTRENKPLWLLNMPTYTNKAPYSSMARFPNLGDQTGPTVISTIPVGNKAPELSRIGSSTLYRGPKAQYGTVTSPSTVTPSNYNALLSVAGVYRTANFDAHLPTAQQVNYLDTTATNPPPTGDPIRLAPNLPVAPDTQDLVQHGGIGANLTLVVPDVPAAIGSVTAVYRASDTTLATPYLPVSPALNPDNTISLLIALPVGTTDVYIEYKPATTTVPTTADGTDNVPLPNPNSVAYVVGVYTVPDVGMINNLADTAIWTPGSASVPLLGAPIANGTPLVIKYVPWPPVYVKYFAVEPTNATPPIHGIFIAGEPLTFKIFYKDADGDAPTYHDGVQGYVKLLFNDSGRTAQLVPIGAGITYVTGVPFGVTLTDVPEGTHPYHFEASDGYVVTRFPVDQTGTGANDEKVQVNYKPSLRTGTVDHISGATTFTFSVTYADRDGVAPAAGGFVQVLLTNHADPTKTLTVTMTTSVTSPNYTSGVRFTGVADATKKPDGSTDLPAGTYDTVFVANDGVQDADPLIGPTIIVREFNTAPVIVDYEVKKLMPNGTLANGAGKTTDTFVYRGWYRDVDNDAPVAVFSGVRQTALTVIVDQGQTTEQRFAMTMVPLTQIPGQPPVLPNYTAAAGVEFQARVTGKKIGPGNHTYTVIASDGTDQSTYNDNPVIPTVKIGPTLMIPFFDIKVVAKDGTAITERSIVGQEVLIQGKMYFPYTTDDQQPTSINNIVITVTKPDLTTVSLKADLIATTKFGVPTTTNWVGDVYVYYYSKADPTLITGNSLTLTASGQWKISASWPGDSLYDGAETDSTIDGHNDQIRIDVGGPSRTIAVLDPTRPDMSTPIVDMIAPPMMMSSTNPGGIFGYNRALPMQIVRWSPSSGQYFWYNVGGVFPPLYPGDAVWIKPKLADPTVPGSGYPAAEPLGSTYTAKPVPTTLTQVPMTVYASHIRGVYLNAAKTGANYYVHSLAAIPFKAGDAQIPLTTALPAGTAQVWVDYVGSQAGVDEGWTALDNPAVQKAIVGGDPRYLHTSYRLVKVLAQSYPLQLTSSGATDLDPVTKLPLLKPCSISLSTGWNQFGNIFYNWRKAWQGGVPAPIVGGGVDLTKVVPVTPNSIGKLLGVYLSMTADVKHDTNYYKPGLFPLTDPNAHPYSRGDDHIHLTTVLPAGTTTVYLRYEAYPKEDVGLPISAVTVASLGVTKSLADAKAAGWIADYAWRYDAVGRNYVMVSATAAGAERVLKAWSGYWIKAYVDCQFTIDPNPSLTSDYMGVLSTDSEPAPTTSTQELEMPPPAPN